MDQNKKDMLRMCGMDKQVERIEEGCCPICGEEIDVSAFKDETSRKEYDISGMCQSCQDDIFG